VARSGLKSVAQGLPWVVLPTRISPEGATRYDDISIFRSEPLNRIACAFQPLQGERYIFD
jgi:hypothetical protein